MCIIYNLITCSDITNSLESVDDIIIFYFKIMTYYLDNLCAKNIRCPQACVKKSSLFQFTELFLLRSHLLRWYVYCRVGRHFIQNKANLSIFFWLNVNITDISILLVFLSYLIPCPHYCYDLDIVKLSCNAGA